MNKTAHAVALNLNMLAGALDGMTRETMSFLTSFTGGWTQAEVDAMAAVVSAIRNLDKASSEALDLSQGE